MVNLGLTIIRVVLWSSRDSRQPSGPHHRRHRIRESRLCPWRLGGGRLAMIKTDVWMPFYTGDYTRATVDLTHAEHGAYLLTMIAYWDNGESLPDRRFRAICGKEFERVHEFYSMVDGRWHHKRIDEELEKARQRRRSAQEKALKGVVAKKLKHDSHNNDEKKDPQ